MSGENRAPILRLKHQLQQLAPRLTSADCRQAACATPIWRVRRFFLLPEAFFVRIKHAAAAVRRHSSVFLLSPKAYVDRETPQPRRYFARIRPASAVDAGGIAEGH